MNLRLLMFSLVWLLNSSAFAGPYELSYSGRLTESTGKPIAGPVNLRVAFFRSVSGNDQVAVAIPDFVNVVLQDGVFQISLSLSAADFHAVFTASDAAYIQVEDLSHSVIYPRQKFSAVPYALKVPVDGESITYNANGQLALGNGGNVLKMPSAVGAVNKVLKSDGAGSLVWADDLSGGGVGTVTSAEIQDGAITDVDISSSAAISSSKISGLGSLAAKSAVGSLDIADGSVTGADIASGTITDSNIGAAANISYLKISGLGSAASKNVGTAVGDVAAGSHTHASTDISGLGSLASKNAVNSAEITDGSVTGVDIAVGTITDSNINASAAISGTKVTPNFGAQDVSTTSIVTAAEVKATGFIQTATVAGAPSAIDCNASVEYGRLITDTTTNRLYVCSTTGWILASNDALVSANNLSDVSDAGAARANLGLGALAEKSSVNSGDITDGTVSGADIAGGTITNANIHATAAIAGTKISPSFGAQNIDTTGTVTAGSFVGSGAGLTNIPSGITSCPTGFKMIGTAGKRGAFCIDNVERTAANWPNAKTACNNLALTEGYAHLCTHSEWYRACIDASPPSAMTGAAEMVDELIYTATQYMVITPGASSCSSMAYGQYSIDTVYRCCIQ